MHDIGTVPPGAQAPGSGCEGGSSPLGAWFTRLCALSPTLERRVETALDVTGVYESCGVWFSGHCPPYCCVCVKLMHRRRKQKNSHLRPLVVRKCWSSRRGTPMWG